jgi:hypothetical protein
MPGTFNASPADTWLLLCTVLSQKSLLIPNLPLVRMSASPASAVLRVHEHGQVSFPLNASMVRVLRATYGAGSRQADVTEAVRRLVVQSKRPDRGFQVENDLLGVDPAYGTGKQLEIEFIGSNRIDMHAYLHSMSSPSAVVVFHLDERDSSFAAHGSEGSAAVEMQAPVRVQNNVRQVLRSRWMR